jgi:hypothetical protein
MLSANPNPNAKKYYRGTSIQPKWAGFRPGPTEKQVSGVAGSVLGVRRLDAALAVPFFLFRSSNSYIVQNAKLTQNESDAKPPHSKTAYRQRARQCSGRNKLGPLRSAASKVANNRGLSLGNVPANGR